ncbi:helicase-related protein [Pelagibacteraceae bacterium]|jgi:ATP-dependent RNA helicase SUPV3L1/SUV3|nr:helicase-related protein [Pelagibacteraceae bacterium]
MPLENNNQILAILGPTNTGKTFLAIERMLEYGNGVIGFPLRLLAREVYDKIVLKIGYERVALVTGEEKIIPPKADYYLCTVESMPQDINFEFAAIDEIQMCADPERGHIFTDRLMNYRGDKLTMFLGSDTIKKLLTELVPETEFIYRERLSKLTYSGYKKISRIKPRSAIIAFSVDDVYALAEFVRRQKGGAAVVMGSLSPKTRNSQVEIYQSGDVDFLIATDAIGMGINMDIDNVYFSGLKKYDGKKIRDLRDSEIGQISGRAGRYMNDGSFGTTGDCERLTDEQIDKVENHRFDDVLNIFWRNSNLDFTSSQNLIQSLSVRPPQDNLQRNKDLIDETTFRFLVSEKSNLNFNNHQNFVKLLWECCQIPDFTKSSYNEHTDIIYKVFSFLSSDKGKITNDWMKQQLSNLNNYEGNIDSLANRISYIRTWSYVSNKSNWVENADYWIAKTKEIEDRLSEKLHEELSKSFVDKRISVLSRGLKQDIELNTKIIDTNKIYINEHYIGKINGLKIELDYSSTNLDTDIKSLKKAARSGAQQELKNRIEKIINHQELLELKEDLKIYWQDSKIAEIKPGKNYLNPVIKLFIDDTLEDNDFSNLKLTIENWIEKEKQKHLSDLISIEKTSLKNSLARGLAYQLFENNGVLNRETASNMIKNLNKEERYELRKKGIKIGKYHIYQPRMIRPNAIKFKTILWKCFNSTKEMSYPNFGINFLKNFKNKNKNFLRICGFETFGNFIIRVDILERLFIEIINRSKDYKFKLDSKILNLLGCTKDDFVNFIKLIGYKVINEENEPEFKYLPKKIRKNKEKKATNAFSVLENYKI